MIIIIIIKYTNAIFIQTNKDEKNWVCLLNNLEHHFKAKKSKWLQFWATTQHSYVADCCVIVLKWEMIVEATAEIEISQRLNSYKKDTHTHTHAFV